MWVVAWVACRQEDLPPVGLAAPPVLSEGLDVPLARRLEVALDGPARLELRITSEGRELSVAFPELATEFDVPVLGLVPDTVHELTLIASTDDGRSGPLTTLTVHTEPLAPEYPAIDVLAHHPDRSEGGYWLVPLEASGVGIWLALYDASDLSLVWLYDGPLNWGDVRMTPDQHVIGLFSAAIEMDLLGNAVRAWGRNLPDDISGVSIPWALNHELFPLDDGSFASIAARGVDTPYPASYEALEPVGVAPIEDPVVVRFAADGAVISEWPLSERLDTTRIGFGSLGLVPLGFDWGHANGVIPDPAGGWLVSVRHQDVLAHLDDAGELEWLLGDPAGWGPPWSEQLLAPTSGLTWPYHAHGPAYDDQGVLWVLDNHSVTAMPYTDPVAVAGLSRIAGFSVAAGGVTQVAEWYPPDALRSNALGSVDLLPRTGNVLADFGMTRAEADIPNLDRGWGNNTARVMEVDLDDPEPIVDVRFRVDAELSPGGINVYRVEPVPSLYGDRAVVTRIE